MQPFCLDRCRASYVRVFTHKTEGHTGNMPSVCTCAPPCGAVERMPSGSNPLDNGLRVKACGAALCTTLLSVAFGHRQKRANDIQRAEFSLLSGHLHRRLLCVARIFTAFMLNGEARRASSLPSDVSARPNIARSCASHLFLLSCVQVW